MTQEKSIVHEKIKNNSYLFISLVFSFFPISFILGSLIVNINFLLFCCMGIYYLKSKILKAKFDFSIKIIFLFFLIVFFSTTLSLAKSLYFEGFNNTDFVRFTKSILFFRFFLFLIIVYLLSKFNILNFKYFFVTAASAAVLMSLDVIYQYIFGFNIMGLESKGYYNSGFLDDELVMGGYIQRFAFFSVFFSILLFKNNKYTKFVSTIIIICIVAAGILFSGNRMPLISFTFGLFLVVLFNLKIKIRTIILMSFVPLFILFKFVISTDESYKQQYITYYYNLINIVPFSSTSQIYFSPKSQTYVKYKLTESGADESIESKPLDDDIRWEPYHRRLFLTALDTWKLNKIFGNGIKSFRIDCPKLKGSNLNIEEDLYAGKKNRLCSQHPHNYYLEILTDTGIVGFIAVFAIALLFVIFVFKNLKYVYKPNIENLVLLSAIISLFIEAIPLKSTGSIFTTNNTTYLILIGSIVLSYKELLKTKIK